MNGVFATIDGNRYYTGKSYYTSKTPSAGAGGVAPTAIFIQKVNSDGSTTISWEDITYQADGARLTFAGFQFQFTGDNVGEHWAPCTHLLGTEVRPSAVIVNPAAGTISFMHFDGTGAANKGAYKDYLAVTTSKIHSGSVTIYRKT